MSTIENLPRWDMDAIFPGFQSPEYLAAVRDLQRALTVMENTFHEVGIGAGGSTDIGLFDTALDLVNEVSEQMRTLFGYTRAITTTDSRDEEATGWLSQLEPEMVRFRKLGKQFNSWIDALDLGALLAASEKARNHEYAIRKAKVTAQHLLSHAEESVISDMEITGGSAWGKLHSNMTSQLMVSISSGDQTEIKPMSVIRTMAYSPDRQVRREAHAAELAGWKTVEVPLAAAMNSIKGESLTLCDRRGWNEPLDEALFVSNIDRETLDAMMLAAKESYPTFHRYLHAKARALGVEKLAFYDLFAPLSGDEGSWDYASGCAFVEDQFRTYSDRLGDFAARAFRENWIDAGPRPGKTDGAYCMGIRQDESRILMNYKDSFGAVSTLAHELGHGYHNLCLHGRSAFQRFTPMTLAETASIFCETIIRQAVISQGTREEKLAVIEASLQGSCQVVVDISSRFLFEKSVFERRRKRELSPREMCELMTEAQLATYGEGLDSQTLHPYMWAVKSHYYGRSFYNFPYMFGLLFGLGLYSVYERDQERFRGMYDDLLSSTGLADAATLAARFGIDIRTPDFWRASLDQIRKDVDLFESLIAG